MGQNLCLMSHPDVSLVNILLSITRVSLVQNKCVFCQLRVHFNPCIRVCSSGILTGPRCGAEVHTLFSWMSASINTALRTITGCLCPTQVDQLPVQAEIAPPALRQENCTGVRPSCVSTRSSATRRHGKFHLSKQA